MMPEKFIGFKNNLAISFVVNTCMLLFLLPQAYSQTTPIPDTNFENYLETHNTNGAIVDIGDASSMGDGIANNGLVLTANIENVSSLNMSYQNISNLDGIEDFVNLETLACDNNNLATINVSANLNLKTLLCGLNNLTSLDIASNTALEVLDCSSNLLSTLDITNNNLLQSVTCSNNRLIDVDVSQNNILSFLAVSNNRLTGLDLSNNLDLESLFCASNQISNLNLSINTSLKTVDVSSNLISNLDLSTINTVTCPDPQTDPITICQGASSINVSNNQLTSLIVANGYNDLITSFTSENNPDLFCIQIDTGFAPNTNWTKDDWTYFGETTCTDIYTYVPDDNFEQALIDLGYDDVLDNLVLTANIDGITTLNISNATIESLIGIEDFMALQTLDCSMNNLEDVDISNNSAIINLNISNNDLSTIDLSNLTNLATLGVSDNMLDELNIENNLALTDLNCSNNTISSLNFSNLTALINLNCDANALQSLNLKNGQNANLLNFSAINNPDLFCIETDTGAVPGAVTWSVDATASYAVNCGTYIPDDNFEQALIDLGLDVAPLDNYVPTVNISAETNLNVSNYGIVDFTGIQDFIALTDLDCSDNTIVELNLTANTALTSILCNNNALEFVDIRNGNNTNTTVFDATSNLNLFCINVDNAIVGNIPAGWTIDAFASYNSDCETNRFTTIPDDNFEQALIDLGIDSGALDNQVLTANIEYLTSLNVSGKNIESLEGIKAFASLTELDCSNNYLNELDVSNMVNLQNLYCGSNYFLTNNTANTNGLLNTTGTVNLTTLFCADNNLGDLNIAPNTNLETLDCANNKLTVLDISNNNNLVEVNCDSNLITTLSTVATNNNTLTNLSCSNNDLSTLSVTNYSALIDLNCRSNSLTMLDITSNNALEVLDFSNNDLTDVNLSGKVNLIAVSGSQNQLTEINDLNSPLLEALVLDNNQIGELTTLLNNFLILKYLVISSNELTTLDVSANTNLIELNVSNNQLTDLLLPTNLNQLKTFNCSSNQIAGDFDLSTLGIGACPAKNEDNPLDFCPDAITINVSGNQLEFVNIQNGINGDILNFTASNNPNLTCIQVDDVNTIPENWVKDATTEFSENCRFGETYVPDDNFEQTLIDLGFDAGALDDYVLTTTIEVITNLNISGNNIVDLTGIEDFTALQNLNCSNNNLSEIDLTENINLIELNCSNNTLDELNLSEAINISNLNISNNLFTLFDASILPNLASFNCDFNAIIELDFQQNLLLVNVSCASNALEILNLKNGQNPNLLDLNTQNNVTLTCIETDTGTVPSGVTWLKDATANYSLECRYGETYVPDDAFEEALISLGFDSGTLDDYIPTSNITNVTTLNVSDSGILDATGIEGFVSLTTLDFQGNALTTIDLSNNLLLTSLNVSANNLASIDVSTLTNLLNLNISENTISEIDVASNVNLVSLDVSSNLLTNLNVDNLTGLQLLNVSDNQLTALHVTLNPNLVTLYCQSNFLVGDQLNLQNGNNENLKTFNASNNPDLACILVDDPVAVISNSDGTYNGWYKDASANYQTICEDADNDGVANADDQCPNTPFGDPVDLFGCSILSLPNNNFTILITGETCLNNNNGKINISTLEYYNYTATLTGEDFSKEYHFTTEIDILNLLAGTYQMCITIEEWPNYMSCYDIVIIQPEPLDVTTGKSSNGKQVSINMSGSSNYNIDFNGLKFNTTDSSVTLSLQNGINSLKVSTDKECQGVYEENIFLSDKILAYPNPFKEKINLYLGELDRENITIKMYSYLGQLVYSKTLTNQKIDILELNTEGFSIGFYTISVQSKESLRTFKIVKK
ncbi:T9SS type A sorting domain-containing protein [Flaviramulus sp. BrNp1-15]|uniref:T9SS type A sorting domain-containing protein n=1 Tax=Flaviramulus sp. BrNp1-15 TaxID=2916754 RepID=UPI001EE81857|nr:T9SS type A sorting domain-containing protein [Flaviramulus sp. BrNp1-15]ULC58569.1 T9SS type A sorting domain-containing protein [Flaviramulus sp. BrNp1-15]